MNDCEKLQKEQNLEDEKLENIKYKNNELSDKYLKVSKEIENFIKKLEETDAKITETKKLAQK
jgi:molecular chaperone GrpE (heat shock protein)